MEEVEQVNSGAPEASPEPQQSPVENNTPAQDGLAQASKPIDDKPTPFHEHPRWKEMVEERNKEREKASQFERQLQELNSRIERQANANKAPSEREQAFKRFKEIDPQFGSILEEMSSELSRLKNLEQTYNQDRSQTVQERYASNLNNLHAQYKVPKELQDFYDAQLRAEAQRNPKLGLNDMPAYYKQIHDKLNGAVEAITRSKLASYTAAKKTDAAVPAAQGKAAAPAKTGKAEKAQWSKDPYEARQQVVKAIVNSAAKSRSQD